MTWRRRPGGDLGRWWGAAGGPPGGAGGARHRRRLRVVLAADYQRLEFLRVLRSHELEPITDPGGLIAPPLLPSSPAADVDAEGAAAAPSPAEAGGDVARKAAARKTAAPPRRPPVIDTGLAAHWGYRALFLAGAGGPVPAASAAGQRRGQLSGPDLLLCLIMAWVMRRPDYLRWADRPCGAGRRPDPDAPAGLWTALVVLATEFIRSRAALTRELNFVVEWLLVVGLMIGMLLAYRLIFAMALLPQAPSAMPWCRCCGRRWPIPSWWAPRGWC